MDNLTVIANEMLTVYKTSTGEKVVNARELHEKLMVGKVFAAWIQDRIKNYGFIEDEDFFPILEKTPNGRPKIDYILTLDVAKEIAMVQNNEMGRAVRKYFIEIEKRYKQKPQTQLEVLQGAINQMVAQEQMVNQLKENQLLIQQENQILKHRMDNYDLTNIQGTPRQRLNAMVRKFATQKGVQYGQAWKLFVQAYNTAYGTNLELKRKNYIDKMGRDFSRPHFLEEAGLIEDAIRVADKLLNQKKAN